MGCEKIFEFQDNAETSIATRKFQAWFRKEEVYLDAQMGDTFITVSLMIFQNIVESILHKLVSFCLALPSSQLTGSRKMRHLQLRGEYTSCNSQKCQQTMPTANNSQEHFEPGSGFQQAKGQPL